MFVSILAGAGLSIEHAVKTEIAADLDATTGPS